MSLITEILNERFKMKNPLVILILVLFSISALANTDNAQHNTNPNYDAKLAADLGADDYGMKKFVLVILKTGSILLLIKH